MNLSISNYLSKITMKKITMLTMLLWMSISVMAQGEKRESKWTVTPRVGMTISDYTNDKKDMYSARTGFSAGVEAEYRISPLIGISGGVFYSSQGAKVNYYYTEAMDMKAQEYNFFSNNHYPVLPENLTEDDLVMCETTTYSRIEQQNLNIPILVNFHVWKGLTLKTGLQVEWTMSARLKSDVTGFYYPTDPPIYGQYVSDGIRQVFVKTGERVDYTRKSDESVKSQLHDVSTSIPVGISYEYKNFELDARYHFGLTKVMKSGSKEDMHTSLFLLTLGYKFQL